MPTPPRPLPASPPTAASDRTTLHAILRICAWFFVAHTIYKWGFYWPALSYGVDFGKHWLAGQRIFEGGSVFHGDSELLYGFNYPQLIAILFSWIALFPRPRADAIWDGLNVFLLVSAWYVAWRGIAPASVPPAGKARAGLARHWALTSAVAFCIYQPAVECVRVGNVEPYNTLLAMGMIALLLRNRDRWAGALWALLVFCKFLPAVLILPWLLWRRWRILQGAAVVAIVYHLLLAAMGRLGEEWFLYRHVLPEISYHWRGISHSSNHLVLLLLDRDDWYSDPNVFRLVTLATLGPTAAVYTLAMVVLRRRGAALMRAIEAASIFIPILAPLLEYHHFVFALPALYLQLHRWIGGKMSDGYAIGYMAGWMVLCKAYVVLDLWPSNPLMWDFLMLYAGLWLAAVATLEAFRAPRAPG
jgi:hypothetical protein